MALGPENARARHNQHALIEKSSLGTDTDRALRESVSAEHGHRIAQEAARRENGTYCPACKLNTPPAPFCTNCGGSTMVDRWPTPSIPSEPAEETTVKAFDIDAAVERVSEAVRAAFVEMQRLGLLGPAGAAESWPTWQDVPDGIWFTRNGLGPIVATRKRGALVDCRRRDGSTIVMPYQFSVTSPYDRGPFVPVEVER